MFRLPGYVSEFVVIHIVLLTARHKGREAPPWQAPLVIAIAALQHGVLMNIYARLQGINAAERQFVQSNCASAKLKMLRLRTIVWLDGWK